MHSKVALWSADYDQVTGQALVTRRVVDHVLAGTAAGGHPEYVYRPAGRRGALASWLSACLRLWLDVVGRHIGTLYLVCSRSNAGFVRDIPALLAAFAGVRLVVHVHGSDIVDLLTGRPLSPLARALYRRCELVLPSRHLVEPLAGIELRRVHVCENFALGTNAIASAAPSSERAPLAVLWNSNVMASKGAFDVMEAVQGLSAAGLAIDLQMIGSLLGDGEMSGVAAQERYETLARADAITCHGRVTPVRAVEMLGGADVVALPSRYSSECQPLAVIDAMCAGKAIIVSDIPALRATLGDYPCEFVPVRDMGALTAALRRLHHEKRSDPAAFVGRRSGPAAAARERFSTDRFDAEMRAILAGLSTDVRGS